MTANNVLFEYAGETQSLGSQFHSGPWSESPRGSLQSLEFGSRFYESNSAEQWPKGAWVYMGKKCQGNILSDEYPMKKKQPCPGM